MKTSILLCGLLIAVLGPLAAQTFDPDAYEELSLSGFTGWKNSYTEKEPRKFKIPVLYSSQTGGRIIFTDSSLEEELEFDTEKAWPVMTSGQKLTIYLTAQGPWVWDRRLDAMEYGSGRLVLAGEPGAPAQDNSRNDSPPALSNQAGIPATNPTPDEIASSKEEVPPGPPVFDYGTAPQVGGPQRIAVHITGKTPVKGRCYQLQVGSFSVRGNAARAANSLKSVGLNPVFEEYRNNVRVVVPNISGENVVEEIRKIGSAGFSEVWCREEP
jgi:hypothetical protein